MSSNECFCSNNLPQEDKISDSTCAEQCLDTSIVNCPAPTEMEVLDLTSIYDIPGEKHKHCRPSCPPHFFCFCGRCYCPHIPWITHPKPDCTCIFSSLFIYLFIFH